METGLRKAWRQDGKLVVQVTYLNECEGDPAYLPADLRKRTYFATFVGWGMSKVGVGATKDEAVDELLQVSGVRREQCVIRKEESEEDNAYAK
jgi:hypothetical protein